MSLIFDRYLRELKEPTRINGSEEESTVSRQQSAVRGLAGRLHLLPTANC